MMSNLHSKSKGNQIWEDSEFLKVSSEDERSKRGGTVKRNDLKGYGKIPLSNEKAETSHHGEMVNPKGTSLGNHRQKVHRPEKEEWWREDSYTHMQEKRIYSIRGEKAYTVYRREGGVRYMEGRVQEMYGFLCTSWRV
jgi:hypothetical protein